MGQFSVKTYNPPGSLLSATQQRLGLTVAPVIVRQVGQKLELTEVRVDRAPVRKAIP